MGCVRDLCNQDDNKSNTDPNSAPKPVNVVKDSVELRKVAVPAKAHEGEEEPQKFELPGYITNHEGVLVRDPEISSSESSSDALPPLSDREQLPDSVYTRGPDAITISGSANIPLSARWDLPSSQSARSTKGNP